MNTSNTRNALAKGFSVALVLSILFGGIYILVYVGPIKVVSSTKNEAISAINEGYDLLRRAGSDLYRALQLEPKISIAGTVVHGPATELTELVTATKDFEHTYFYQATWAGSTKRLELKGDFVAKAGFPINDSFGLKLSEDGRIVTVHHSKPILISSELKNLTVVKDENGWWNKLTPEDREAAHNSLLQQARTSAEKSDLMAAATQKLLDRLTPLQEQYSFQTADEVLP
ncbi:DUF4230 domain-containing protein [Prosthecobacter sp.]|jgi:hypothetical protein|uniref:DUF4230 domain-containing protein n=1 Tax=Prosthecobacter sp. TaxID=1965333 RepID=UPI0037C52CBE